MRYIRSHTALRGIAALLVCVYHYVMFVCGADWMAGASRLLANGYAAVDLFFVLSGYILTARYGHVFAAGIERGAWRDFINRRFARLYPLHLATLAMALPFALFRKNADLPAQEVIGDLALNLLMVQSWGFRPEATFNFPSWSISVEWGAYLVFPLLAALFLKGPRGRLALLGLVILGYAWIASMGRGLEVETEHRLIRGLLGFALGMLAFAWRDLGRIAHPGGLALAQVVAAGGAILTLSQPAPVGVEFMPFAAALTVLLHEDRGPLGRAMQGRGAVWLGEASYSGVGAILRFFQLLECFLYYIFF